MELQEIQRIRKTIKSTAEDWDTTAASFGNIQVGAGLFAINNILEPKIFYVSGIVGGLVGGLSASLGELTVARRINKRGYTGSCSVVLVDVGLGYTNVVGYDQNSTPVLYFNGFGIGIEAAAGGGRFEMVNEVPSGNYKKMKCINAKTGESRGFLATHDNYLSLVVGRGNAANVKWLKDGNNTYLDKDTSPNDRYLGLSINSYAGWGLKGGERNPVIYNSDQTISLKDYPTRKLYGPYEKSGIDWVRWTEENETNDDVLRFVFDE